MIWSVIIGYFTYCEAFQMQSLVQISLWQAKTTVSQTINLTNFTYDAARRGAFVTAGLLVVTSPTWVRSIAMSVSVCLSVRLPVRISWKSRVQTSWNFLCIWTVAVARSSSGFVDHVIFAVIGQAKATPVGRILKVTHQGSTVAKFDVYTIALFKLKYSVVVVYCNFAVMRPNYC